MTDPSEMSFLSTGRLVLEDAHRVVPPEVASGPAVLSRRRQSLALATAQNRLCGHRTPISLRVGGAAIQAALTEAVDSPAQGAWLELEIDGHPAHIGLSWGTVRRMTGLPLESADPVDAAVLFEEALSTWLDGIEEQTGLTVRFRRFSHAEPVCEALRLGLRAEVVQRPAARSIHLHMPLILSEPAANSLAPVLSRWNTIRPETLPLYLRLAVEIETTRLSMVELRSLNPGDALVLADLPSTASLVLEEQFIASAQAAGDGLLPTMWRMTGRFRPRQSGKPFQTGTKELMSEQEQHPSHDDQQRPETGSPEPAPRHSLAIAGSFDALEIRLSFRLGERLMSLAELRRAGPGTIVTLDRPDGAMVDIVANGQLIGTGEVISVAGQRAVEIRSLFSNE
ncbi:FliM/FliN family flagellar motor switch protein [Paracoccus alkanivorans]|nr:FliM/FliN family flagellar motor switch protein [Paracoccus alkanivorans]